MSGLFRKSTAVKNIQSERDVDKLINALEYDGDYEVRDAAAYAIKKTFNDAALDALGTAFSHDEHRKVRLRAYLVLKALQKAGNSKAAQVLSSRKTWDVSILAFAKDITEKSVTSLWALDHNGKSYGKPFVNGKFFLKYPPMCVCCGDLISSLDKTFEVNHKLGVMFHGGGHTTYTTHMKFPCCDTCDSHFKSIWENRMTKNCAAFISNETPVFITDTWDSVGAENTATRFYLLHFSNQLYAEAFAKANHGTCEEHVGGKKQE